MSFSWTPARWASAGSAGSRDIEVVQNPYADSVFASGAILLRAINDVDVWAWDAYRSVYAKNALSLGVAGTPVPFGATGSTGATGAALAGRSEDQHRNGKR